jgi:F-box and leucine-rich repeat protein 2/20
MAESFEIVLEDHESSSAFLRTQFTMDFFAPLLWSWLDLRSLGIFDTAVTNKMDRCRWIQSLANIEGSILDYWRHSMSSLKWLMERNLMPMNISTIEKTQQFLREPPSIHPSSIESVESYDNRMTDKFLIDLVRKYPRLVSINLTGDITDVALCTLARECSQLQSIGFYFCYNITSLGISSIITQCSQLQYLTIRRCISVCDIGLSALGQEGCQLKLINLTQCYITDSSLFAIAQCSNMQSLTLENCSEVTDVGIITIAGTCSQLQSVNLTVNVTDIGISALAQGCPLLQSITLNYTYRISDAGLASIGLGCPHLLSFSMFPCDGITDLGISAIASGCPKLQSIKLYHSDVISDTGLIALATGCHELESILFFYLHTITDIGLSSLTLSCPLKTVSITYCRDITDNGVLYIATNCSQLESLTLLSFCGPPVMGVNALGSCQSLRSVTIHCINATDVGFAALADCTELRSLTIHGSYVTDEVLEAISNGCLNLENLSIVSSDLITDMGLSQFSKSPKLENVRISRCSQISDVSIAHLVRGCNNLQSINAEGGMIGYNLKRHLNQKHRLFIDMEENRSVFPPPYVEKRRPILTCLYNSIIFVPRVILYSIYVLCYLDDDD